MCLSRRRRRRRKMRLACSYVYLLQLHYRTAYQRQVPSFQRPLLYCVQCQSRADYLTMNLYLILLLNLWFIQPHAVSAHRSANYILKFMWAHTRTVVVSGACSDMSHKTAPAWVLKHIAGSAHLAFISQTVNKPRLQDPEGHCVKEQHATPSSSLIKAGTKCTLKHKSNKGFSWQQLRRN